MSRTTTRRKAKPAKTQPAELPATGYVRIAQLIPAILPFSEATLWRMVKRKTFPAPVKLSANITAWSAASVRTWMDSKQAPGMEPEGKAA